MNKKIEQTNAETWSIEGELILNCNCTMFCPCVVSRGAHPPTEGYCQAWLGVRIDKGKSGLTFLSGLNVAMLLDIPGKMERGNWTTGLWIDERATDEQFEKLEKIFTGSSRGTTGLFKMLVGKYLGAERSPISFVTEGQKRTLSVGKFIQGSVEPIGGLREVIFLTINRHYRSVRSFLQIEEGYIAPRLTHLVVVLVGSVNRGVLQAVKSAESLRPDRLLALSVVGSPEARAKLDADWAKYKITVELEMITDQFRDITDSIVTRINELDDETSDDIITVVIPEFVTSLRSQWLHNQSALSIKGRLLYRPNTVVTSVLIVIK